MFILIEGVIMYHFCSHKTGMSKIVKCLKQYYEMNSKPSNLPTVGIESKNEGEGRFCGNKEKLEHIFSIMHHTAITMCEDGLMT